MATWIPEKKISETTSEEIKFPWGVIADPPTIPSKTSQLTNDSGFLTSHQDISGKANLSGGNTFTGKQTLNSPASDGYSINAAGYVKGSWLQASAISNKGSNTGKVCVFDNSGWIYYRTPAEILTEAGGANLSGGNTFSGNNQFGGEVILSNRFEVANSGEGQFVVGGGVKGVRIDDVADGDVPLVVGTDAGTSGQVLTSQGAAATPQWKSMPTYSLSGTTLTITLP